MGRRTQNVGTSLKHNEKRRPAVAESETELLLLETSTSTAGPSAPTPTPRPTEIARSERTDKINSCKLNSKEPLGPIIASQRITQQTEESTTVSCLKHDSENQQYFVDKNYSTVAVSAVKSSPRPGSNPDLNLSPFHASYCETTAKSIIENTDSDNLILTQRGQMLIRKCPKFDDIATVERNRELDSTVFTFKPSLSNASKKIAETLTSDFMSRQQQHIENQKKHIERADILYKKSLNLSPRSRRHPGRTSKEVEKDVENESGNENEKGENPKSPINTCLSETISEEEEKEETLAEEEIFDELDEMPAVNSLAVDRMKTTNSAKIERLLEGPYATSHEPLKIQKNKVLLNGNPGVIPRPVLGDRLDGDKENETPGCLPRSKTMPFINRPKLGRKCSIVADGERLRNAKELVDKAIKYRKVFTIQGGYASIRNSLRKRGWVEKFYKTTGPKRPTRTKRRKQNSESDDSDNDDGNNNEDDDDDDDDGTDDDTDEPKIPPWEEEDGLYGIMSRMVRNVNPLFFWVLKRDVIDYRFLLRDQMVNHYCKAGSFTTKVGLCVNLRNVRLFDNADQDSFCPRCYRLSHDEDKEAFIDDYRLTACMNIVKIIQNTLLANAEQQKSDTKSIDNCAIVNINTENKTLETVSNVDSKSSRLSERRNSDTTTENSPPVQINMSPASAPSCKDPKCAEITKDGTKCVHLKEDEIKDKVKRIEEEKKLEENKKIHISPRGRDTPTNSKASPRNAKKKKKPPVVPIQALEQAITQCENYLRFKSHQDIDDVEELQPGSLNEGQWNQLLQWYYNLAHDDGMIMSIPQHLIDRCNTLLKKLPSKWLQFDLDGVKNVWIVKPGAKSRGRGIVCHDKLEDMLKLVSSNVVRKDSKYVVQKYMERPLLIYNTKFDIRQWFLVTDWNPLTIWFYQDSYFRFCSQEYTLDDFDESIHLSNNAIQKHYKNGPRSSSLPADNMWTHEQFKDHLKTKNMGHLWEQLIYPGMKKAIQCALLTAQDLIEYRKSSFELYGADFMLTEDYRPWLIEINSSPSMEASTAVTARMCNDVLDDTIKVVLDRKQDRNCDIGRFELAYKQPIVTVPPYIGINMQVEGQGIRKPFGYKKPEPSSSITDILSPQTSRQNVSEKSSSTQVNNEPRAKDSLTCSTDGLKKDTLKKSSGTTAQSSNIASSKQMPKLRTSVEASDSDCKLQSSVSDTGISRSQYYNTSDISPPKVIKSGGASHQPEPPAHPKLCMHTPYVSVGNRRIVSKTSVSMNYTIPGNLMDRPLRPTISVKNVETTDIRHIKAQKGLTQLIPTMWCRMCSECGYGTNLHFHAVNPNCKCRRDRIVDCILNSRPRSAHLKTSRSKLSLEDSRPPSAARSIQKIKAKYSGPMKVGNMDKVLLKYTDGSAKRHQRKDPLPRVVGYYIKNSTSLPNKQPEKGSYYLETSKYTNPLYITTHKSNIQ